MFVYLPKTIAHRFLTAALALHSLAAAPADFQSRPAIYEVTTDIINADVQPFTFTAPAFGNTLRLEGKGAFEPATFRTQLVAQQDSPDRIYDDRGAGIVYYDVYQSGYLDGAGVRVYRIVNGTVELVREDVVAPGGTVIESWSSNPGKVIQPTVTRGFHKWDPWGRPGSQRWYSVVAVDAHGNESEPGEITLLGMRVPEKNASAKNEETNFRAKRGGDNEAPPAPTNVRAAYNAQGVIELTWDPVNAPDLAGYRIVRTDTDPASHRGTYLQLTGSGEPIKAGDMVIVNRSLAEFTPEWMSNRIANLERYLRRFIPSGVPNALHSQPAAERSWRLAKHVADSSVSNPGEYYLEMTLAAGETQNVGQYGIPDLANTEQEFYPVPKDGYEYIMEVWMKADQNGRAPVTFTWDGDERIGGFIGAHPLEVTDQWQKYEVRFTGQSAKDGHHAYMVLKTQGPGTFSFDNYRVYRADTDYLDYLPHEYEALKNSGMSAFRTHGPIKTFTSTYSMLQYLGEAGQAQGVALGNTLPQALQVCEKVSIDPWLQIEYHMSPEEWLAFMEYMAAPFDPKKDSKASKPYAALRYAQGQTKPWIDVFDTIYFELSNETWNGMFKPWVFANMTDAASGQNWKCGQVYAMFHDYVVGILRSSPYWKSEYEETFVHVLGGWSTSLNQNSLTNGYTQEIATVSETAEYITIAAYNGGWDEGEGPPAENPASYFNVLSQVNQTAIPRIIRLNEVIEAASNRLGREVKFGTYEAGPGYAMNGLNGAKVSKEQRIAQENVMKSKLAGVATLDSFLARTRFGSDMDNFFTFAHGDFWKSHAKKHRGGQPHASFLPLQMFNQLCTGDMLLVNTESTSTVDTEGSRRRQGVDNGPLTAAYVTRDGQDVTLICINRMVPGYPDPNHDGHTIFGIKLPFNKAENITLYRMNGAPTDHNIWEENVSVESIDIPTEQLNIQDMFAIKPETGGTPKGMPPSEVYIYKFHGTNIGAGGRILSQAELRAQPTSFSATE